MALRSGGNRPGLLQPPAMGPCGPSLPIQLSRKWPVLLVADRACIGNGYGDCVSQLSPGGVARSAVKLALEPSVLTSIREAEVLRCLWVFRLVSRVLRAWVRVYRLSSLRSELNSDEGPSAANCQTRLLDHRGSRTKPGQPGEATAAMAWPVVGVRLLERRS